LEKKELILDPLTVIFCAQMSAMTPGMAPAPCQAVINASSAATQATATLNSLQTYMEQTTYKIVDKDIIYGSAGVIYLINSFNTKTLMATFPLKPFEFNLNLGLTYDNIGIKYKLEF